jgi:hypothetical protein
VRKEDISDDQDDHMKHKGRDIKGMKLVEEHLIKQVINKITFYLWKQAI